MPKLKTVYIREGETKGEHLHFKYDVNVNADGWFTTTLSEEVVVILLSYGIELKANYDRRNSRIGYFERPSLNALNEEIQNICKQALSRTLTNEKLVIKYQIETTCSYLRETDGTIVPNAYFLKGGIAQYAWLYGTKKISASNGAPFGMEIYAKPFIKRTYSYANGKTKEKYCDIEKNPANKNLIPGESLLWLDGMYSINPIPHFAIKEIDYSEPVAAFFVRFIKTICEFSEKIKDFIEPEGIELLAQQSGFLLTGPKE